MLFFLSILGVFLSVLMLSFSAKKFAATLFLGFFFLSVSLYVLSQYIILYSKSVFLITFFLYNFSVFAALPYLIGPMLYWYVRSVLNDNEGLNKTDSIHLLLMVIYFLISLPQNSSSLADKISDALSLYNNTDYVAHFKGTPLSGLVPVEIIFVSRPAIILLYTLYSSGLFINYLLRRKKKGVLSRQYFMTKWLALLLGFIFILVFSQILSIIKAFSMEFSDLFFTLRFMRLLSGLGLIGLLISPFFFPAILYGLPRMPDYSQKDEQKSIQNFESEQKEKAINPNFELDYLHSIGHTVTQSMKEYQAYLQPDCNLTYFSKLINVPPHHLAYYFREVRKQRFNDFRNECRINHAKALIQEGKANEITLEAIGSLSGFSSRNAFITDFKKQEGESPGSYAARFN